MYRLQGDDFWKEVAHFRQVAAEVETFCQASGKSQTKVVAESEWNEKFIVNNDFCILLGRQLLQTLQDEYEKLPPLNIAERPPTKWTC
jgi:hypothetical protein